MDIRKDYLAEEVSIGILSAGLRMSLAEFQHLDPENFDENYHYELVHGVLIVTKPPSPMERDPNDELGHLLRTYNEQHPHGHSLDATLFEQNLTTLPDTMRRADRVIWAGLGRDPDSEIDIPSIVIEFVSGGRRNWMRDYEEKRDEYLNIGVIEYWVFDRFKRQMSVYRQGKRARIVKEYQSYESTLLPGFVLSIDALLARADKWTKKKRK